jgi:hypothetical protein
LLIFSDIVPTSTKKPSKLLLNRFNGFAILKPIYHWFAANIIINFGTLSLLRFIF